MPPSDPRLQERKDLVRMRYSRLARWMSYGAAGKTRQEVAAKLAEALPDREGSLVFDVRNLMLCDYLDLWLRDSGKDTVWLTTYQGYERIVRLHIKPTLARVKLENLRHPAWCN